MCICRNIWSCCRNILLDTEMQVFQHLHTMMLRWLAWDCLLFSDGAKIKSVHAEPIQINWFCASQHRSRERRTEMSTKRWNQFIAYSSFFFRFFFLSSFCFALHITICNNTSPRWNWMNDIALNLKKNVSIFVDIWTGAYCISRWLTFIRLKSEVTSINDEVNFNSTRWYGITRLFLSLFF